MSVTEKVRREVCKRDRVFNPNGYDPHHCFPKGLYFGKDVNDAWNISPIKREHHRIIHNAENVNELARGHKLDIECMEAALTRYKGLNRKKLEEILNRKKIRYGR